MKMIQWKFFLADEGFTLDEADIDYINGQYRDSFMRTMELLVPHMKTFPTFKTQK